jgi:hypothetical protein
MGCNSIDFKKLIKFIIINSSDPYQSWDSAKLEWSCYSRLRTDQHGNDCLCGYKNLKNLCYIRNRINNKEAIVGSCCVEKFEIDNFSIKCFRCKKVIGKDNKFYKALYSSGKQITPETKIIGHERCLRYLPFSKDNYEIGYKTNYYKYLELYRWCSKQKQIPIELYYNQMFMSYYNSLKFWCKEYNIQIVLDENKQPVYKVPDELQEYIAMIVV